MTGSRFTMPYVFWVYPSGEPIPGALLEFFAYPSTSTHATTYADTNLATPNTNPVVADGNGIFPSIWLDPLTTYNVKLSYPSDGINPPVQIWTAGPVYGAATVPSSGVVWVDDYGAQPGNLTFDSYAAIAAALASGAGTVMLSNGGYRSSAGITVPDGVTLKGVNFQPGNPPLGSLIQFDAGVLTCVTLSGGDLKPAAAVDFCITRASGAIPSGSIGLLFNAGYNLRAENIGCYSHDIGFKWLASGVFGISSMCHGLYTGAIQDAHIVFDTWPEAKISQCRFGNNGGGDLNCNTFVRFTGGGTGGAGPNTIFFSQCQFNQGSNSPTHAIEWVSISNTIGNAVEFGFGQCHFEMGGAGPLLYTDSTCQYLNRLWLTDTEFNCTSAEMWGLNAATQIFDLAVSGCLFYVATFTLATPLAPSRSHLANSYLGEICALTLPSGTTMNIANCSFRNCSVAGAGNIVLSGCTINGGAFTNTSTGRVIATNNSNFSASAAWTPTLTIGGASTGITYTQNSGTYEYLAWNLLRLDFQFILTNKGALTGAVAIGGLPQTLAGDASTSAGLIANYLNMTSLTGPMYANGVPAATTLNLIQGSSTGTAGVTNANLTNTTNLQGSITVKV